jgi:cell division protein FtsQ
MRSLIGLLLRRGKNQRKARRPRPSILQRRRRQFQIGVVGTSLTAGLVAGAVWVHKAGYADLALAGIDRAADATVRAAGFTVREVYVVGRDRAARRDVAAALGVKRGDSMLGFDPEAARRRLLDLGWVKQAQVFRRFPDVVEVSLEERRPLALWQYRGRLALIDDEGETIIDQGLESFADLPIVVGPDAPSNAADLMDMLKLEPALFAEVQAAVRVGGRRWDVQLKNGVMVNLPEIDARASWTRLARLAAEHSLLQRDIRAIDLRLPDRLVVRMSPEAAEARRHPGKET